MNPMKAPLLLCAVLIVPAAAVAAPTVHFSAPDVKINSNPAGTSYNGGLILCDNHGTVYAIYNTSRNAGDPTREANALEVYFNLSTDRGTAWGADKRIDSGPGVEGTPDRVRIWSPFIGCDESGRFCAGWMDGRDFLDPLRPHPGTGWWEDGLCNRTTDYGLTWLPADVRVNGWDGNYPRCAMPVSANDQDGNLYVVWYSTKNQPVDYNTIFVNHSPDFGATWDGDRRIDSAPASASEWSPQVRCDRSGNVYAAWHSDSRRQIRFNYSHDHGMTWQTSDVRVDRNSASGTARNSVALACDDSGNVYAAWKDLRDASAGAQSSIYFNRSLDHGVTWGATDIRLDGMGSPPHEGPEYGPQIACTKDGTVYVVWEDKRFGGEWDVFFNRSVDHGATWETANIRLDTDTPGAYRSFRPQLGCDAGDGVYVAWEDWREGLHHIYMNYSMDRGATWRASDMRVDTDTALAHAEWPRLCVDDLGGLYVAWGYRRTDWTGECGDMHMNHYDPGLAGACCHGDSCTQRTWGGCEEGGGVFHGAGSTCSPDICQTADVPRGAADGVDGLVRATPNPFSASTTLWFRLGTPGRPRIEILDVAGHRLRLLELGELGAGLHSAVWDGLASTGTAAAPGIYFARLSANERSSARVLVRVR
jgi:hypothetical protein